MRSIMQVIVSCPLIIPDEPIDSNALEAHIQAWGRALMALAFQQCWQQYQAHAPACPCCQQPTTVADGSRPYALRTLFGTVRLARQRRRCRACGRIFQPLDPLLGAGSGRATTGLRQAAMLAAASWPFATAAWLLHALSGAEVSAEWVRQVAEAAGQVEPPTVPAQGLIAVAGGYVQRQDNPAGMEGKVVVLATGRERVGRERWRLTGRRYVASFGSAATFGPLGYQVATEAGVAQAALLGCWDGASWHFPTAERRLDLWHLLRRGAGRGTAGGGGPGALGGTSGPAAPGGGRACPGAGAAAPEGAGRSGLRRLPGQPTGVDRGCRDAAGSGGDRGQ